MQTIIQEKSVGYTHCKECGKGLRKWEYRLIGYCHRCYAERFPKRESRLPALRSRSRGELVSPDERARWQKPFDEIDEKIDREDAEKRKR